MLVQSSIQDRSYDEARPAVVYRELPADLETPVSVYLKLAGDGPSFLLESVTGGEQVARYSFIGVGPRRALILQGGNLTRRSLQPMSALKDGSPTRLQVETLAYDDPLDGLRDELRRYARKPAPGLPRFAGGLVGYLSYDIVRHFEPSVPVKPHAELPEAIFLQADTLVAFDHAFGRLMLIAIPDPAMLPGEAGPEAEARLAEIERRLAGPVPGQPPVQRANRHGSEGREELVSNVTREDFIAAVERAKEYIAAGDIFQVVLSQRLGRQTSARPFDIYRALRRLNPSPYMYYFDFDGLAGGPPLRIVGASPEMHVRLEGRTAAVRPIAGTRPRGRTSAEDESLECDLLADPKERAEHAMLVDLARNDLGRVCEYGSVRASELMAVERYSHVMHLVSHVEGRLRRKYDAFDLMAATFPAGTVSGAPKIRAMQIIDELEKEPRGPYAGAVGYFSYDGSMDTCITIRTLVMQGEQVSIQAGAGIVADSEPEREYQETLNKARALAVAVEMAEQDGMQDERRRA